MKYGNNYNLHHDTTSEKELTYVNRTVICIQDVPISSLLLACYEKQMIQISLNKTHFSYDK